MKKFSQEQKMKNIEVIRRREKPNTKDDKYSAINKTYKLVEIKVRNVNKEDVPFIGMYCNWLLLQLIIKWDGFQVELQQVF